MLRLALFLSVFISLGCFLAAQEPTGTGRISIVARYVPNSGNPVSATIPEAVIADAVIPLQIAPDTAWLVTVDPVSTSGQVAVAVSDVAMTRTAAGITPQTPISILRGQYPLVYGRPIVVLQTGTYRLEVQIGRL